MQVLNKIGTKCKIYFFIKKKKNQAADWLSCSSLLLHVYNPIVVSQNDFRVGRTRGGLLAKSLLKTLTLNGLLMALCYTAYVFH